MNLGFIFLYWKKSVLWICRYNRILNQPKWIVYCRICTISLRDRYDQIFLLLFHWIRGDRARRRAEDFIPTWIVGRFVNAAAQHGVGSGVFPTAQMIPWDCYQF